MNGKDQKTILLVEDEAITAMSEKMDLEKYGYDVITVLTGEEAVAMVEKTPAIDLVLMDVNLGDGMDGTEAAALILRQRDLPVVFLSSHREPEIVAKTEKITSYGYVVKDSSITVLDASIKMAFKLFAAKMREEEKEKALRESQRQSQFIADQAPVLIAHCDHEKRYKFVNRAFASLFGLKQPDVIGRHPREILGEEAYRVANPYMDAALAGQSVGYDLELPITPLGARAVSVNYVPEHNEQGDVIGFVAAILDITVRQHAEKSLRRASRARRTISGCNQLLVRAQDEATLMNGICRLLVEQGGYRMTWVGFAEQDEAKSVRPVAQAGFEAGYLDTVDITWADSERGRGPTGTAIRSGQPVLARDIPGDPDYGPWRQAAIQRGYASSIALPLLAEGRCIGALNLYSEKPDAFDPEEVELLAELADNLAFGIGDLQQRALLERKKSALHEALDEMQRFSAALRESEERFRTLVENSTIGIYRTTPDGRILLANPAMAGMLGYLSYEDLATRDLEKTGFEPSYPRRQFIETIEKHGEIKGLESAWTRKDGTIIHVRESARRIRDARGKTMYYDGTVEDISERKQAEEEIQRQLAEKEILLKEVHHRIKNNIASISGLITLHMQTVTHPEAVAALQDANNRVTGMRLLYDKLLLSEGYRDIAVKNYLDDLVEQIIAIFPGKAPINIVKGIDDFPLDAKRLFPLGIILNELLTNAMKYAFINRKTGRIEIALTQAKKHVTLIIQDNGRGLPEGFDLENSRGFGLMLVKMLSQQLGGNFAMETRKGTRCTLEFDI